MFFGLIFNYTKLREEGKDGQDKKKQLQYVPISTHSYF